MRTTKERMKSGEAFVGMKSRGSQLFQVHSLVSNYMYGRFGECTF